MKFLSFVLCAFLLFHVPSSFCEEPVNANEDVVVGEEPVDDWEEDDDAVDMEDGNDVHASFQTEEFAHMASGNLGESMYASIFISPDMMQDSISDDLLAVKDFILANKATYKNLVFANTGSKEPMLWVFPNKEREIAFTVHESLLNGKISEKDLQEMPNVRLPSDAEVEQYMTETPPIKLTGLTQQEIHDKLIDNNVRPRPVSELEAEDEEYEDGEDGEKTTGGARKKRVYGSWKEKRAKRLAEEKEKAKDRRKSYKPYIRMGPNMGLEIPMPILMVISAAGLSGVGYLVVLLRRSLANKKRKAEEKQQKLDAREKKRMKKRS
eukprot:234729_1